MNVKKNKSGIFLFGIVVMILLLTGACKKGLYAPAEGDTVYISAENTSIKPGESTIISVTGVKSGGRPMPDQTLVRLTADSGAFFSDEQFQQQVEAVALLDGKGQAYYKSVDDFSGESVTITASSGSAVVVPEQLVITITSADITKLGLTANPGTLGPDGGATLITVTAVNSDLEPVPDEKIWIEATAGSFDPQPPLTTDVNGQVTTTFTTTVTATVTATYGAVTQTLDITVGENTEPVAQFTFSPANPVSGETVYFVSTSFDADNDALTYSWNFGNGDTDNKNEADTIYHVTAETEFNVVLIVTDPYGASSSATQAVKVGVGNAAPVASFAFSPETPNPDQTILFDASASADTEGSALTYTWDFGDGKGQQGEQTDPTYTYDGYNAGGTYVVTLIVNDGQTDSDPASLVVLVNIAPTAIFFYEPTSPTANSTVQFNGSGSYDEDGTLSKIVWDFGDGKTTSYVIDGDGNLNTRHNHRYDAANTYTVKLTVIDDLGATSETSKDITVH